MLVFLLFTAFISYGTLIKVRRIMLFFWPKNAQRIAQKMLKKCPKMLKKFPKMLKMLEFFSLFYVICLFVDCLFYKM